MDPDTGETFTYSIGNISNVVGNNSPTLVNGNQLSGIASSSATKSTFTITATDHGGLSVQETYTLILGGSGNTPDTLPNATVTLTASGNNIIAGLNGADTLSGTDGVLGSDGIDYILGNSASDTITGKGGADVLLGGDNDDTFVYLATSDSTSAAPDTIRDFTATGGQHDFIDVRAIDANSNVGGIQHFSFNGTAATANGIWYTESGGNTTLHFDTNGNTANDEMRIVLTGTGLGLTTSDFVLS